MKDTQLDCLYELERTRPNDVWLTQPMGGGEVRELTFAQAADEVRRMAAHLVSLGLPKPSQIALFSKNSAWWILADLAIWMAGHVSVPLYPTLEQKSIRQILEHSESKLIFIGKLDGYEGMAPGIPADMPRITTPLSPKIEGVPKWADIVAKTEPMKDSPRRDPSELATIIYTSGSTGTPKGVMHSFATMMSGAQLVKLYKWQGADRMLSYLPLAHVAERLLVETNTLATGFQVFFAESLDTFVADLRRARPTLFFSVPRLWMKFQSGVFSKMPPSRLDLLLKIPIVKGRVQKKILQGLGLADCRIAASGSAPIPTDLLAWYRKLGLELLEGYGMTENFCYSHATRTGEVRVGYVGRPYDEVTQRISDEGEIQVKSPATMLGYYKAPELTAEVMTADGFLKTGDRGEIDEMGRLRITGRVKELFKTSKGKYVAPAPIESLILADSNIEQACVSGAGYEKAFGMVVLSPTGRAASRTQVEADLASLLQTINAQLDPHEQLEMLVVLGDEWTVDNGLLTPTMKLKRAVIEERYKPQVEGWYKARRKVIWDAEPGRAEAAQ